MNHRGHQTHQEFRESRLPREAPPRWYRDIKGQLDFIRGNYQWIQGEHATLTSQILRLSQNSERTQLTPSGAPETLPPVENRAHQGETHPRQTAEASVQTSAAGTPTPVHTPITREASGVLARQILQLQEKDRHNNIHIAEHEERIQQAVTTLGQFNSRAQDLEERIQRLENNPDDQRIRETLAKAREQEQAIAEQTRRLN